MDENKIIDLTSLPCNICVMLHLALVQYSLLTYTCHKHVIDIVNYNGHGFVPDRNSLRSKRFCLVSEQRKAEGRDSRFRRREK